MKRLPLLPKSPVQPLRKDPNRFRLGAAFQLPNPSTIPNTDWLVAQPLAIKNQKDRAGSGLDDMCTAFALTSVLEPQEGELLDAGYTFAKVKQAYGDPNGFGGDLQTVSETAQKRGALAAAKSPFPDRFRDFVADWHNWPEVYDGYAAEHRQQSYFEVKGPFDHFDNIRASLWLFREKKRLVLAASYWYPQWAFPAVIPKTFKRFTQPSAHAFCVVGQKIISGEPYLVVQQSYGTAAGENGYQYFSREVVNSEWKDFGAFMFVDMDPEEAKKQMKFSLFAAVRNILAAFNYQLSKIAPHAETLRQMAARVCVEEGLNPQLTKDLIATIEAESGFNPKAENHNKNGTVDYGLCQLNSKWYIGPSQVVKTPEEALNDPEKCVRVMARAFKAGRAVDWIAYKTGAYKKYLT